jgi:hypothetical protein
MSSNKELKLAYGIAGILLVVGVLCYTALLAKDQGEPLRMVFKGVAGSVLFDHKTHTGDYGLSCADCHHHPETPEEGAKMLACKACHVFAKDGTLPASCLECHGAGEVSTDGMTGKTDAFHAQCIGCHKQNDAGPVECAACHGL